jgi:putative endonuclease
LSQHFVYIVRCRDGSLYVGYARDPKSRLNLHNNGRGAKYTRGRRPVRLVYSEAFATLSAALRREYELKQWPRARKQALIRSTRSLKPIVRL